jgi:hypothetical protein
VNLEKRKSFILLKNEGKKIKVEIIKRKNIVTLQQELKELLQKLMM